MRRLLILLLMSGLLAGCEKRVIRESFASLRPYADKPSGDTGDRAAPTSSGAWSIPLGEFEGEDRYVRVQKAVSQLRRHELPPLWFEDVGTKTVLHCGRFDSASAPEAQLALDALSTIEVEGEKPYKNAKLKPLLGTTQAPLDPLDLRQYAGFYTLEVAVFTADYPGDRKAAAEKLARELRRQQEDAYFYHGPHTSSVCIGLFDESDFMLVGQSNYPGPRMNALQERHPGYLIDNRDSRELPQPTPEQNPDALPRPTRSYFVEVL